jgi:hypothetical protein
MNSEELKTLKIYQVQQKLNLNLHMRLLLSETTIPRLQENINDLDQSIRNPKKIRFISNLINGFRNATLSRLRLELDSAIKELQIIENNIMIQRQELERIKNES